MEIRVDLVKVENRVRQDFSGVEKIKKSIQEIGVLLQPIVVDENYKLIAGECRLRAFKELGIEKIPATVINLDEPVLAESAENEDRSDFTVSEKVEMGKRREAALGRRLGINQHTKEGGVNCAHPEGKTRDIVAKEVGFSSGTTYERAKKVVDEGAPELVEAVNQERIKPSVAVHLTELPEDEQAELSQPGQEAAAREAAQKRKEEKRAQIAARKAEYTEASNKSVEHNPPKIYLKDCIEYMQLMDDDSVDLLVTDPPYSTDIDNISEFVESWLPLALDKLKSTGRGYICAGAYPVELNAYLSYLLGQDKFTVDAPLIWTYRNTLGQTPNMKYNLNYQVIFHIYSENSPPLDKSITNEMFSVQDINAPDGRLGNRYHTWQKPDELAYRFIKHSSKEGQIVFDPFACTGTFLIAASKFDRVAMGCEINQEHLSIAEERGCHAVYH